jgi:hypothetical protein
VQSLEYRGWKAEQVGDDLVFTRTWVIDDTVPSFPIKGTQRFEVYLPSVNFPTRKYVAFAPGDGSRLVLSAPDHFIVRTSPAESRQAGVGKEIITFSLNSTTDYSPAVEAEVLSPLFRKGPLKVFAPLATFSFADSFTSFVRWLAAIVAFVFSEQIKRVLSIPIRGVQRRLNISIPEDTP